MENILTTTEMEVMIRDLPVIMSWGQVAPNPNSCRNYPMK